MQGDHTHRWTVAVYAPNGTAPPYASKVVFELHETYDNPKREIKQPPFEVTETGWGEFDIRITVHFLPEMGEKPVSFYHHLKLHPFLPGATNASENGEGSDASLAETKCVNSWFLDEFIFADPTETTQEKLNALYPHPLPERAAPITFDCAGGKVVWPSWSKYAERLEAEELQRALAEVERQCEKFKSEMSDMQHAVAALKKEVASVEQPVMQRIELRPL